MRLHIVAALWAGLMLAGCAGSLSPTIKGNAQEIFHAKGGALTPGWGKEGMVITLVDDFSSELREASRIVYANAAEERRDLKIALASEESSRDLGPEGLAALSKSSGSRFVLKPRVSSSTQDRFTIVEISAALIDSRSGETLWEGTGTAKGSHTVTSLLGYHNLSVNKKGLLKEAAHQLLIALPR